MGQTCCMKFHCADQVVGLLPKECMLGEFEWLLEDVGFREEEDRLMNGSYLAVGS